LRNEVFRQLRRLACPACGKPKTLVLVRDGTLAVPLLSDPVGSGLPVVAFICSNCGNVQLHHVFRLGLGSLLGVQVIPPEKERGSSMSQEIPSSSEKGGLATGQQVELLSIPLPVTVQYTARTVMVHTVTSTELDTVASLSNSVHLTFFGVCFGVTNSVLDCAYDNQDHR